MSMTEITPVPVFVAYQVQADSTWLETFEQFVQPDRRLKDPAKIQASLEERRQDLRERAALTKFCGSVTAIRAALPSHSLMLTVSKPEYPSPAYSFLAWLKQSVPSAWTSWSARSPSLYFIGFGIDEFMQMVCTEALSRPPAQFPVLSDVPLDLWHHSPLWGPRFLIDPLKILFPNWLYQQLAPEQRWPAFLSLCAGGLAAENQSLPGFRLEDDLRLLMGLTVRYQLVPLKGQILPD